MKTIFLVIFAITFTACTMTWASAQADNFSVGFVSSFGSRGTNATQFHNPQGITVDGYGNLYVVDQVNNRVEKFDSKGNFASVIGYASAIGYGGSGDGQFNDPTGVAVDKSGDVYVIDSGNFRIVEFSGNGTVITKWGSFCDIITTKGCVDPDGSGPLALGDGQFRSPTGIAIDNSGRIYVTDNGNSINQIFDSSGHFIYKFGTGGSYNGQFGQPHSIVVAKSGNIYVTEQENARVQIVNLNKEIDTNTSNDSASQSNSVTQSTAPSTTQNTTSTTQNTISSTAVTPPASVPALSSIQKIPSWAKGIFYLYGQGQISDQELINAVNFLIQQGIVQLK